MTPPAPHRSRFSQDWTPASIAFLILSIVGLIATAAFNVIAILERRDYLGDWFTSGAAVNSLGADLFIVAVSGCVLIVIEARRLGMRFAWVYIVASGVTAIAFTFPLFLCARERRISALRRMDRSVYY